MSDSLDLQKKTRRSESVNVNLQLVNQRILACPLPPDAIEI